MANLSDQQINFYNEKGYVAPIDVLSKKEANEIRQEIEIIEKKWPNALEGIGRNYVHLISPVFNKVCLNNKILDALGHHHTHRTISWDNSKHKNQTNYEMGMRRAGTRLRRKYSICIFAYARNKKVIAVTISLLHHDA